MKIELSETEKRIKQISEEKNPYSNECTNKHLWSEGYRSACNDFKELFALLESASTLVGSPLVGISSATDIACDEWQNRYKLLK